MPILCDICKGIIGYWKTVNLHVEGNKLLLMCLTANVTNIRKKYFI